MSTFCILRPLISAATIVLVTVALVGGGAGHARAKLKAPSGDIVLILAGKITETNIGDEAQFDRDMLAELGMKTLKTTTPFEEGEQVFEGPLMSAVLDSVGVTGNVMVATALDGYTVEIPVQDMRDYPVLLALTHNGEVMNVRSRGPTWIIYPITQYPNLVAEKYSARSIWQIERIEIR